MKNTANVALVCLAALGVATLLAVVGLVVAAPPHADLGLLIGLLVTGTAGFMTNILTLGKVDRVTTTVDELANGKMDAKIRAGVADVLNNRLIDPGARQQLDTDRHVRDGGS